MMLIEKNEHRARIVDDVPHRWITFAVILDKQKVAITIFGPRSAELYTSVSAKDFLEATEHIRQIIEAKNGN